MIFFNVPSVGQFKASTLFGEDENHYGFMQTVIGEEYKPKEISKKCNEYYFKDPDVDYWGRIITLIRFGGIRRLDLNKRILSIPLLDFVQKEYDLKNTNIADMWLNYFLCMWQHPHPMIERDLDQRKFTIFKPYSTILSILLELYRMDKSQSFLTNDEFYWIGYSYHKSEENFSLNNIASITQKVINMRENGGWKKINDIPYSSVHLSYPKGLLKNSFVLTSKLDRYRTPEDDRKLFIGLNYNIPNIEDTLNILINFSKNYNFQIDPFVSNNDILQEKKFSEYLFNQEYFNEWIQQSNFFNYNDLTEAMTGYEKFDNSDYLAYKRKQAERQLERLSILDREVKTRYRTEQKILRDYLFKEEYGKCAICKNKYPSKFFSCAHIKKRADCSDIEKKDLNVVMPACYFGCDVLYEKGYIVVEKGKIKNNTKDKHKTKQLLKYINDVEGNYCSYYNDESKSYFNYHLKKHG